ncbi:hypothetical protein FQR65_LT08513 [Abscondita terminalis]|nr:hypothetical protein FQR65_LT08513 [Abscondita terminalis]
MVVIRVLFLMTLSAITIQCQSEGNTLQLVFRHGDRTNDKMTLYPKDPYFNYSYYPYGHGQLTNVGLVIYVLILNSIFRLEKKDYSTYTPDILYATSTAVCRTKTSLLMLLAGLFPPASTSLEWGSHLNWSPIPFTYNEQITHVPPFMFCREYQQLYKSYLQSDKMQEKLKEYVKWFPYLTYHTGFKSTSYLNLVTVYYHLKIQDELGMKMPLWSFPLHPHILKNATIDIFHSFSATKELKRLYGGKFMKNLVNIMMQKVNGTLTPSNRKLFLYSGHDLNVLSTLYAFNTDCIYKIPSYGACVLLELHKNKKNDYFVKIFYDDYELDEIKQLHIKGCGKDCPFDKLISLISENFPTDESVCNEQTHSRDPFSNVGLP